MPAFLFRVPFPAHLSLSPSSPALSLSLARSLSIIHLSPLFTQKEDPICRSRRARAAAEEEDAFVRPSFHITFRVAAVAERPSCYLSSRLGADPMSFRMSLLTANDVVVISVLMRRPEKSGRTGLA